jgi:hypothetical protein
LIYRSNQAPLRGLDRLKRRKPVLNLELLDHFGDGLQVGNEPFKVFELNPVCLANDLRF